MNSTINKKKIEFIISFSLLGLFMLLIIFSIIFGNTWNKKSKTSIRIPFKDYFVEKDDNHEWYQEKINGCPTNNIIIVYLEDGKVKEVEKHIKEYDEVLKEDKSVVSNLKTLTTNAMKSKNYDSYEIDEEEKIYYVIDGKMTPIMMYFITAKKENRTYDDMVCINLATGEEINANTLMQDFD